MPAERDFLRRHARRRQETDGVLGKWALKEKR
jgi:hypothetical protein